MEKALRVGEVEGKIVECVALKRRVKAEVRDVCSGAVVVLGFLKGGASVVDLSSGLAGVEVRDGAVSVVECVKLCTLAVDMLEISSKSASSGAKKKVFSHKLVRMLRTDLFVNN